MSRVNGKKGQVAVEFILMFVFVISVIIYAFYFSVSFAALHYKSYEAFMVGRAVLASSDKYSTRLSRAQDVQTMYDQSAASKITMVSALQCNFSSQDGGFRGIMDYKYSTGYDVYSNAGIACSVYANYILPSIVTRNSGNTLQVAVESMTGSEISDEHCKCAMDPGKKWSDCLQEGGQPTIKPVIDNGC